MENQHPEKESLHSHDKSMSQYSQLSEATPLISKEVEAKKDEIDDNESENSSLLLNGIEMDDELEKPWPATFERSISLLAGPTMDTDLIDKITKSPRITPNLSKRRVSLSGWKLHVITFLFID